MLSAAITFAEALDDSRRAEKVADIKAQLEASIEEIVQHQNLLQRKLTDQLEDIARRRSELDELEKSSIEEMLAMDKKQRTEVGSTFEGFLLGSQQVSNPRACSCTPSFDGPKLESEAGENIDVVHVLLFYFTLSLFLSLILTVHLEYKQKPADEIHKDQACNESLLNKERPHQDKELEEDDQPPWHSSNGGSVEEEAICVQKPCFTKPEDAFPSDNPYIIAPDEQPSVEDTFPINKVFPKEDPIKEDKVAPKAILEASQAKRIIQGFNDAEKHPLNQYKKVTYDLDNPCEPSSESGVAPIRNAPAEDLELLVPPPRPALSPGRDPDFHPPPPPAPSSIVTSVIEAAAPEAPEDSHTITLEILNSSKVLRSVIFIKACT